MPRNGRSPVSAVLRERAALVRVIELNVAGVAVVIECDAPTDGIAEFTPVADALIASLSFPTDLGG